MTISQTTEHFTPPPVSAAPRAVLGDTDSRAGELRELCRSRCSRLLPSHTEDAMKLREMKISGEGERREAAAQKEERHP